MKSFILERKSEWIWAYLLLAPSLILFGVFVLYPIIRTFMISFTEWNLLTPSKFIGLENFKTMLGDARLGIVIKNTLTFTFFAVIAKISLGLLMAYVVWSFKPGILTPVIESALFFPVILPMSVVAMVWGLLFNTDFGVVNGLLMMVGISRIPWVTNAHWALPTIIILDVWKGLGFFFIVYLVALRNVPKEYYEAAAIDGAGRWATFRYITLACISPTTLFLTVIATIGSLQVFDSAYILTHGGPGDATSTMVFYLWQKAFQLLNIGYAASLALLLFGFVMIVTLVQFLLSRKLVFYE